MTKEISILAKSMSIDGKSKRGGKQDVRTPHDLFFELHSQFVFDLDPCDSREKPGWLEIPSFNLDDGEDGLKMDWYPNVFINPPWADIQPWIDKAEHELSMGHSRLVVFLVPNRTETKWYHSLLESDYLLTYRFLKKRVHFDGQKGPYVTGIGIFVLWQFDGTGDYL